MKATILLRRLAVVCLPLVLLAPAAVARVPGSAMQLRTFQSVANVGGGLFGHYLTIDDSSGKVGLSARSGQDVSETYWELDTAGRHRGYQAHVIRQRGDSKFNGHYLGIDTKTGQIVLSGKASATTKWLIRYMGKHNGFDSYYIQNLASGGFDFRYLTIDERNGKISLDRQPVPGAHWCLRKSPDLPTEGIR